MSDSHKHEDQDGDTSPHVRTSITLRQQMLDMIDELVERCNAVAAPTNRSKMMRWLIREGAKTVDKKLSAMEELDT